MNIRVVCYVTSFTLKHTKQIKYISLFRKMNYSNNFDVLQEDDESSIPLEKQLRNKKKRLREIEDLKSKPYDQLNEAQKKKLQSEQQIKDDIDHIESSIKEQTKPQNPQQLPVQKKNAKKKRKKNVPKTKKKNEMTKEQREAYEKHKEKVKQEKQQKQQNNKRRQKRQKQQKQQKQQKRQKRQKRKRQEAEQERWYQEHFKQFINPLTNIAWKFANNNNTSIENANKKITEAKHLFNIEDLLNIDKREVRRTYHKLSLKHHPDKGGDTETMKKVNDSNEILNELISYN